MRDSTFNERTTLNGLPVSFCHYNAAKVGELGDRYYFRTSLEDLVLRPGYELIKRGFNAQLVEHTPETGIVVTNRWFLGKYSRPNAQRFVVSVRADKKPNPYTNIEIVLNRTQAVSSKHVTRLYLPVLPQQGLIARDPHREDKFETLGYFGVKDNLVEELQSARFLEWLDRLDLRFEFRLKDDQWKDYGRIDAVLAVRRFDTVFADRPAAKLYNSWIAGVPAILGAESAFRSLRQGPLDFLECRNMSDVKEAILRLKNDVNLRRSMIANGLERARQFTERAVIDCWEQAFAEKVLPAAKQWFACPPKIRKRTGVETRSKFLTELAEQGHRDAQFRLGLMYFEGDEVRQNRSLAIELFKNAADQGDPEALKWLGRAFAEGMGVKKSKVTALGLFLCSSGMAKHEFDKAWKRRLHALKESVSVSERDQAIEFAKEYLPKEADSTPWLAFLE